MFKDILEGRRDFKNEFKRFLKDIIIRIQLKIIENYEIVFLFF